MSTYDSNFLSGIIKQAYDDMLFARYRPIGNPIQKSGFKILPSTKPKEPMETEFIKGCEFQQAEWFDPKHPIFDV